MGKQWKQCQTLLFWGSKITADGDCSHEIKRCLLLGRKVMTSLDSILKSRDITLPTKVRLSRLWFTSSHVWMLELDYIESWVLKNWCFWTLMEKTLESPLDFKEIQTVHSEGDQPWDLFGRNDARAETPVLWLPHVKSWLIGRLWWTWVSVNSGSWWWTGRPGMLRFMGSQRVEHDWASELNWTDIYIYMEHMYEITYIYV